jgi:hypothetical protein
MVSELDMDFIDPDLLLAAPGFTEEELLDFYRDSDEE